MLKRELTAYSVADNRLENTGIQSVSPEKATIIENSAKKKYGAGVCVFHQRVARENAEFSVESICWLQPTAFQQALAWFDNMGLLKYGSGRAHLYVKTELIVQADNIIVSMEPQGGSQTPGSARTILIDTGTR